MKGLFFRLYLLLAITLIALGWSIDQLYEKYNDQSLLTTDIDIHKGSFFILDRELTRLPVVERGNYIQAISPSFGFPIQLLPLNELTVANSYIDSPLNTEQFAYLQQGGLVALYDDFDGTSIFLKRVQDSAQVLAFGPIVNEGSTKANTLFYVIFLAGLAAIVFAWVWPISSGLARLAKTTIAFGRGDFSARIKEDLPVPLAQLAVRFNAMAERIERLLKSHKDLSHAVSHELRTPIARIRFAMEMVREVDDEPVQHKYLDTMDDNIEELDGLVDELLTYARFDREEPQLNIAEHDLVEISQTVLNKFRLTHTELTFSLNSQDNTLLAEFDAEAIMRVLDNLVRNAVRYADKCIDINLAVEQGNIVISVDDDGAGVPEEYWQTLFDPFVRLDKSRDRNSGGIGLGLAIVKRYIGLHQGEVSIGKSLKLGGASFKLQWAKAIADKASLENLA